MTRKSLQLQQEAVLEMVVGFPISWFSSKLHDEAQKALTVREEALAKGLSKQAQLQENYIRALAFLNRLAEMGISVEILEGNYEFHRLDVEHMPPLAVKILHAMETMPHPVEIEEWAIAKPARRVVDPYLAFKVADHWYFVYQWV